MLASDVITSARYTLSDLDKKRWSDTRLIGLLNDGLSDVAKTTTLFIGDVFVGISDLVVDYDLSDRAIKIERIEYLDTPLPIYSFEEMDERCPGWQLKTGDKPEAVIVNHQNQACFKIFPIVENAENSNVVFTQVFGIVTNISYSDIQPILVDNYGDIGSLAATGYLRVYYVRKHAKVTALGDTVAVSDVALEPLGHYVAGRALRDNQDVQNRAMAAEELKLYQDMKDEYSLEKKGNFNKQVYQTKYRGGIS